MLRQKKERNRCCPRYHWYRLYQSERKAPPTPRARIPQNESVWTHFPPRCKQIQGPQHPCPRTWWWFNIPAPRNPLSYCQVRYCLLPEVSWRGQQERTQRTPHSVWQRTPRCRSKTLRTQKVRRSRCQSSLPKILSLNEFVVIPQVEDKCGCAFANLHLKLLWLRLQRLEFLLPSLNWEGFSSTIGVLAIQKSLLRSLSLPCFLLR